MRRWGTALVLCVIAALVMGCMDPMISQRLGTLAATQISGGKKSAAKATSKPTTPAPRPRATATPTGEPTPETPEPTVDYRALGEATLLQGDCFQGFVLYPGAADHRQAQNAARNLAVAVDNAQTRGYSVKASLSDVRTFYDTMPAVAHWEPAPYAREVQGGGIYYWGKPAERLLIIVQVGVEAYGQNTLVSMVCGQVK